jgi:hypothetical protein
VGCYKGDVSLRREERTGVCLCIARTERGLGSATEEENRKGGWSDEGGCVWEGEWAPPTIPIARALKGFDLAAAEEEG